MHHIFLCILGIAIIAVFVLFFVFVCMPWTFGATFQSSSKKEIKNIIKLANIKKSDKIVDLGSGNGKLVIELAKTGAEVHGYEINPLLVWWSRRKIKKLGLKKVFIHEKSFWDVNLKKFDVIAVFQIYYVMKTLSKKIKKEAKKNVRIVSNTWKLPGKKPIRKLSNVYLYAKT